MMNEVLMLHFFTGKAEMKTSGKGLWGWAVLVCFHGAISGNRDLGLKSLDFSHYILFCLLACLFPICVMSLACFHTGAVSGVLHLPKTWKAEVGGLLKVRLG